MSQPSWSTTESLYRSILVSQADPEATSVPLQRGTPIRGSCISPIPPDPTSGAGPRPPPRWGPSYCPSGLAYFWVHSRAVAMAAFSSSFQALATSAARGSSGLGAPRRAWIESRMVRIWRAGDQLSEQGYRTSQP